MFWENFNNWTKMGPPAYELEGKIRIEILIKINKPWMRHIFILMKHEFEPGSEIIMIWIWNRESWHYSCGGKVGTPHFFENDVIQETTVINNLGTVSFVSYGFNSDGILMTQDVRIVLHILLTMLRDTMKLWGKIASSKPKRVSNRSPIRLNRNRFWTDCVLTYCEALEALG